MSMNAFLAEQYGTNKTAAATVNEDFDKEAAVDLFMKLAEQENIDLSSMPEADVNTLFNAWATKAAAEGDGRFGRDGDGDGEKDDEEKKKERKAREEHEEKKASAQRVQEADYLGRVMAHSFVQESDKIAAARAGGAPQGQNKEAAMPESLRKGLESAKGHAGKAKDKAVEMGGKAKDKAMAAGASFADRFKKKKEASALDSLAAEQAVHIAFQGGLDPEEAGRKVAAVLELGLVGESVKVASAPDFETAVPIRALELLEAAGYPIDWNI